jgi:hypothetical protein
MNKRESVLSNVTSYQSSLLTVITKVLVLDRNYLRRRRRLRLTWPSGTTYTQG